MNKRNRLIILLVCVALFLVVAPYLVMYSMGYRIDFQTRKITSTGGIYVRTTPTASEIIFDDKDIEKPSMFSSSVFVQDLLPKQHTVLIKKDGYFDYYKKLDIEANEVSKIENVILFKNTTEYQQVATGTLSFYLSSDKKNILAEKNSIKSLDFVYFAVSSPNNSKTYSLPLPYTSVLNITWSDDSGKVLIKTENKANGTAYYLLDFTAKTQSTKAITYLNSKTSQILFNPQDSSQIFYISKGILYSAENSKSTEAIKNLISYSFYNNGIIWLSTDGNIYKSDIDGKNPSTITAEPFVISDSLSDKYKIIVVAGQIFFRQVDSWLIYNQKIEKFESFPVKISDASFLQSPDRKNMAYYNGSEIYLYSIEPSPYNKDKTNNVKLFSANSGETISNCYWLNNDYIIFESGSRIIISEIDFRGNINQNELPNSWPANSNSSNPQFIFNSADNKSYVLTGETLYFSEKLIQ